MRKEVKLGMAIGAGLIALLVVYLLVAPPSNNKKGAQLAGANGAGGDIAQPGDLATPENTGERVAIKQDGPAAGAQTPRPSNIEAAKADPGKMETPSAGKSGDQWSVLNTGKGAPKTEAKSPANDTKVAARTDAPGAMPVEQPRQTEPAKMYFDPHAAWGGGVSDGALGSPRVSARPALVAGSGAAAALVATGGRTHVIKQGETFSSIAQTAYGNRNLFGVIVKANPNVNPSALKPGMTITLPTLDEAKASQKPAESGASATPVGHDPKIDAGKQYKVQSGDSLYKISVKLYGKSTYVDKIYDKNKTAIGADPKKLKLGMILDLPEKPALAANEAGSHGAPARANTTGPLTGDDAAAPENRATSTITDGPSSTSSKSDESMK